jgi:trans-2,3-dihydro-3-hydroxyanthranilate isomerase
MSPATGYRLHTVDVFTERPLAGNQLAVVLGADAISGEAMQAFAREMNLSETTFVQTPAEPGHAARVRIFTPAQELPFAGHPTLGTAWVIWRQGLVPADTVRLTLEEGVGPISVRIERRDAGELMWMTHPPVELLEVIPERARVAEALGLSAEDLVPDVPIQVASTGMAALYVALRDARAVDAVSTSASALAPWPHPVFVFARVADGRLYSRMFAPHTAGIAEDPATGSASGPLGALAVRHGLVARAPRVSILSEQGTKMLRPSSIHIELEYAGGADLPSRIEVGGAVVAVASGEVAPGLL